MDLTEAERITSIYTNMPLSKESKIRLYMSRRYIDMILECCEPIPDPIINNNEGELWEKICKKVGIPYYYASPLNANCE